VTAGKTAPISKGDDRYRLVSESPDRKQSDWLKPLSNPPNQKLTAKVSNLIQGVFGARPVALAA
jgi:hypothetical protein